MTSIPLVSSLFDIRNISTLGFYSLLGCFSSKLMLKLVQLNQPTFSSLWKGNLSKTWTSYNCEQPKSEPSSEAASTTSQIEAISIIALALSLIILPFLPATNIFFYVGFVVAERLLYLPSLGYSLLLGLAWSRLNKTIVSHYPGYLVILSRLGMIIMIISAGLRTISRNKDWKDEETLFR